MCWRNKTIRQTKPCELEYQWQDMKLQPDYLSLIQIKLWSEWKFKTKIESKIPSILMSYLYGFAIRPDKDLNQRTTSFQLIILIWENIRRKGGKLALSDHIVTHFMEHGRLYNIQTQFDLVTLAVWI